MKNVGTKTPDRRSGSARSARTAGLRYVTSDAPGIRRRRAGRGFAYYGSSGRLIRDRRTLARIRRLAIPPAWSEVWICRSPHGHLQAVGRDERGRKQYRYHASYRKTRDIRKFDRMIDFGLALPRIRERVSRDLNREGLPKEKVLAAVVRLLERTLMRVGNEEYARNNHSFGLTTLKDRHVRISDPKLEIRFRGKGGQYHHCALEDRRLARIVRECRDLPGYELFQYVHSDGKRKTIDSGDVNDYLREITGEDFTAKDFRTWAGTFGAAKVLLDHDPKDTAWNGRRSVLEAVEAVARSLGNRPVTCRNYYIHPAVLDAYPSGLLQSSFEAAAKSRSGAGALTRKERAMLALIRQARRAP